MGTARQEQLHHNQQVELTRLLTRKFLLYSQTWTFFVPSFYSTYVQGLAFSSNVVHSLSLSLSL